MEKLIKARKAALGVLCAGLIIAVIGILGSALAVSFGQNASGYAVIVLIPIGVFGSVYGAYMIRTIDNCRQLISDVKAGKTSIDELCAAKTEDAKRNTKKLIDRCIAEGLLEGYKLDSEGKLNCQYRSECTCTECRSDACEVEGADSEDKVNEGDQEQNQAATEDTLQ